MAVSKAENINLFEAIHQICAGKGLEREAVLEIIEEALIGAYRKKYNQADNVRVILDKDTNDSYVIATRTVGEASTEDGLEISLEDAREAGFPDAQIGETVEIKENPLDFSRVATVTAKNIVVQKIKEMERANIFEEFKGKEGELIHGYFQWGRKDMIFVDLGNTEGIMPRSHQMPNEKYRQGDRIKAIIHEVVETPKGPKIVLSRTTAEFVRKLFELEIPEIYDGIVEIVAIARQAGVRTKIVVHSHRQDVDPVGACVGMRGVRIQSIVRELGKERVDIIQYTADPEEFVVQAMSPVNIEQIRVDSQNKEAVCIVKDEEKSHAIGNAGSNVKLACQVTGYKIEVRSESQFQEMISSPENRAKLDALFSAPAEEAVEMDEEEELDGTPLGDIPGLTRRVIDILNAGEIRTVEDLVETDFEDLIQIPGMTRSQGEAIMAVLAEVIEFEE